MNICFFFSLFLTVLLQTNEQNVNDDRCEVIRPNIKYIDIHFRSDISSLFRCSK